MQVREEALMRPKDVAWSVRIHYHTYLKIEALNHYPSKFHAQRLSEYFGILQEDLFPDYFQKIAVNCITRTIPEGQIFVALESSEANKLLVDKTNPLDEIISEEFRESVRLMLSMLTPREAEIIKMRFGFNDSEHVYTLAEVAKRFSIGKERVRQIEHAALNKLRSPMYRRTLERN